MASRGNRFWRAHHKPKQRGVFEPAFQSAEEMYDRCLAYFEWNESNPLYEAKLVSYKGRSKIERIPKMRAMSIQGLCSFLGISTITWRVWRKEEIHPHYIPVMDWAEEIIYQQKFEGAAADLLNASLVSRDLGLAEKHDNAGSLVVQLNYKDAEL